MKELVKASHYSLKFKKRILISDFSHSFEKGKSYFLIGENGSGKTSFLKDINMASMVKVDGLEVNGSTALSMADAEGKTKNSTVYEYFKYLFADKYENWFEYVYKNTKELGFTDEFFTNVIAELSGGQKRLVDLARVVLLDADIVLIDELENNLDQDKFELMIKYIKKHLQNKMVIYATHSEKLMSSIKGEEISLWNEKKGGVFNVNFKFS